MLIITDHCIIFYILAIGETRIVFSKWPGQAPSSNVSTSDKPSPESEQRVGKATITISPPTEDKSSKTEDKKDAEESPPPKIESKDEVKDSKVEIKEPVSKVASSESWVVVEQPPPSSTEPSENKDKATKDVTSEAVIEEKLEDSPVKTEQSPSVTLEKPASVPEPVQVKEAWGGEDVKEKVVPADVPGIAAADPMAVEDIEEEIQSPPSISVPVKPDITPAKKDQSSDDEEVFSTPNAVIPQVRNEIHMCNSLLIIRCFCLVIVSEHSRSGWSSR